MPEGCVTNGDRDLQRHGVQPASRGQTALQTGSPADL